MLNRIITKIKGMVGKAILAAVDDTTKMQLVKIEGQAGVVQDRVERVQNYGFTSNVPPGGEAVVVNVAGSKDHPVCIALDHTGHRKKDLKPGEVAVYDKNGSYILLKEDGSVEISSADKYVLSSDSIMLGGDKLTPLAGVVTGECLDPVTGVPFPDKSATVFAKK